MTADGRRAWRSRGRAATALAAVALLPAGLLVTAAHAAPGDDDPPPPQSTDAFCAPVPDGYRPFTDVAGNTHEDNIRCAAYGGIAEGGAGQLPADRYGPDRPVLRDQMASFIARALDEADRLDTGGAIQPLPPYDGSPAFVDVPARSPHFEAVNRLAQVGVVQGGAGGQAQDRYGPDLTTDRAQMAAFVDRALRFATGAGLSAADDFFVDDERSVHEASINAVAGGGIAVGDGFALYRPEQVVPRDQMASFLVRSLGVLHEAQTVREVERRDD